MNSSRAELNKPSVKRENILLWLLGPGWSLGQPTTIRPASRLIPQAGAQFGYGLLWTVFLTTPFMIAIQLISAQIGRVTGPRHHRQCKRLRVELAGRTLCARPEVWFVSQGPLRSRRRRFATRQPKQ
jgi:hypothetical protein